jgi:hypothetical protein
MTPALNPQPARNAVAVVCEHLPYHQSQIAEMANKSAAKKTSGGGDGNDGDGGGARGVTPEDKVWRELCVGHMPKPHSRCGNACMV